MRPRGRYLAQPRAAAATIVPASVILFIIIFVPILPVGYAEATILDVTSLSDLAAFVDQFGVAYKYSLDTSSSSFFVDPQTGDQAFNDSPSPRATQRVFPSGNNLLANQDQLRSSTPLASGRGGAITVPLQPHPLRPQEESR